MYDIRNKPYERKESISSWASSSGTNDIETPSHTTAASTFDLGHDTASISSRKSSSIFTLSGAMASIPEPGHVYMIREANLDKALTVLNGELTLMSHTDTRGGWQWHCEQNANGWMGFRDAVSGRYLGHDNRGGYVVQAKRLSDWESFVIRHRKGGGYNLCVKYGHKLKPMGTAVGDGTGMKLVDAPSPAEAAVWAFIEV